MTSARGHGAIVYCLNSGSEERQTGRHNMLCEGNTMNRWRDGQVGPDVRQGTMAPWARRLGRERGGRRETRKSPERTDGRRRKDGDGRRERVGVRDWREKDDERRWR
ncbi:hypothetical protein TNCV_900961 [Trichonephila clavipes]|nr:hypothetical protein TNCV_900961 [Trichonephila clavipes]